MVPLILLPMAAQMVPPAEIYEQEAEAQEAILKNLQKRRNLLGWLRLGVVLLTAAAAYVVFSFSTIGGILVIVAGIAAFLYLVATDANNQHNIKHTSRLIRINQEELAVLQGRYLHRDDGSRFQPEQHNYAADLDVLGKASLYQYLNRCNSEQGQQLLAADLLQPIAAPGILARQEALRELSPDFLWRQQLQARSLASNISFKTQHAIERWLRTPQKHFTRRIWRYLVPGYSAVTVTIGILAIAGIISFTVFTFFFLLFFTFSTLLSKKAMRSYTELNGIVPETDTIYQVVEWIELRNFKAPLLQQVQQSTAQQDKAHIQLKKLKEILNRFDLRLNALVFIFVNSFLLWDVRQIMALNDWRAQNKSKLSSWFEMIASFEVLNSLATLHFNQPSWAFPEIPATHFTLQAKGLGHPLLAAATRVASDFTFSGTGKVAIVTGSNMAGKSTFLRSLGTNIVLAQIGAPVCAQAFSIAPVRLMSSMRIADNLAENTSTFYAELKKLKTILEAVNRKEQVFILLDEILRGTNSLDRHTGSMAVVRQLIRKGAVAVIATHDVAIGRMEEEYPGAITNYHFDVQVAGEELYFDYKLKDGICTSLNASLLMKKIGIEL